MKSSRYLYNLALPLVVLSSVFRGDVRSTNMTTVPQDSIDCDVVTSKISSSCYDILDITSFLTDWNTTGSLERCSPTQSFSNCLLNAIYTNGTRDTFSRQNISQNDCSTLDLTPTPSMSNRTCPHPLPDQKKWYPSDFYTALTIFNVHSHLSTWAQALSDPHSVKAITTVLSKLGQMADPGKILSEILDTYGLDHAADSRLGTLVGRRTVRPQAIAPISPASIVSETVVSQLNQRLAVVLQLVMEDVDALLFLIQGGAYSAAQMARKADLVQQLS